MDQLSDHLGFLPDWAVGPIIALLIIIIGYFISKIAAAVVAGGINRTGIGKKAKTTGGNIGKSLSKAVFWVLWLIFILMGLSQFPVISNELTFLNGMMDNIFNYLPQLIVGIVVFAIGLMLANVVQNALTSTLEVAQVDKLANRFGVAEDEGVQSNSIAKSFGGLAKAIVILLFAIAAIGIWDIPGFSDEVSAMLGTVLDYIPSILGAAIILGVSVFIGRFVSNLAKSTLPALGVDKSLSTVAALDGEGTRFVPSNIIATIAFIGIVLMGLTAAMKALGIPELTNVFNSLLEVGGRLVLGAIIIGAGIFIANFVAKIVTQTSGPLAGKIIKYVAIIIFTFMGLETVQLGEGIVDTAFSYSLMAAAVAGGVGGAIAFGLGGREWAAKKLQEWMPAKGTVRKTPKR
ncbi:mechanosensitive ion channel [Hellea sp.]|nr:mechanosensitive ion channel [Hellea sp.]